MNLTIVNPYLWYIIEIAVVKLHKRSYEVVVAQLGKRFSSRKVLGKIPLPDHPDRFFRIFRQWHQANVWKVPLN